MDKLIIQVAISFGDTKIPNDLVKILEDEGFVKQ